MEGLPAMFLLGLLGTGHCVGMCGPLVLALPTLSGGFSPHLFYHLGRTLTYVTVGASFGGLGTLLAHFAEETHSLQLSLLVRLQVSLSLVAGVFLLLFGLTRLGILREPSWMSTATPTAIPAYGRLIRKALSRHSRYGVFLMGLLLGFIPCGLSYGAFSISLASGEPTTGAAMMLAFALGTMPGLLLIGGSASRLALRYRKQLELFSGILMIGMSASLIVKGVSTFAGT